MLNWSLRKFESCAYFPGCSTLTFQDNLRLYLSHIFFFTALCLNSSASSNFKIRICIGMEVATILYSWWFARRYRVTHYRSSFLTSALSSLFFLFSYLFIFSLSVVFVLCVRSSLCVCVFACLWSCLCSWLWEQLKYDMHRTLYLMS